MWFNIQKASFKKLYRHYGRKLRGTLLITLFILPLTWLFLFAGSNFFSSNILLNNFQIFTLFFFQSTFYPCFFFLFRSIQLLSGVSQGFFQLRGIQTKAEETYLILFLHPNNRQTMFAAKMAASASYYFLINLFGLTFPTLLFLVLKTSFSLLTLLGFFALHSLVLSSFFFFLNLPQFYFISNYSLKNAILSALYVVFILIANVLIISLVPLLAPFAFLATILAGGYFTYLYWKIFRTEDFG